MKKKFKLGQNVVWVCTDFDGSSSTDATITEVYEDHCIAETEDNITLWIDADTEYMFHLKKGNYL